MWSSWAPARERMPLKLPGTGSSGKFWKARRIALLSALWTTKTAGSKPQKKCVPFSTASPVLPNIRRSTVDLIRQVRWLDFDYDSPTSQGYAKADPRMSATSETPDSSYVRYQATQMVARRRCLAEEHLMGRLLCQLAKIDQRQVCAVAVPQWKSRNLAWPFFRKFPKGTRQFLRDPNFFPLFHERQHDTGPVCTKTTLMLIVMAVEIGTSELQALLAV